MSCHIKRRFRISSLAVAVSAVATSLFAQVNVAPQPVNTSALPDIAPSNDAWTTRNPYRDDLTVYAAAQKIGQGAFEHNCARCHGANAVSDGIVPDLRYLDPREAGDLWFISRYRHGLKRDGKVHMPPMGEALGQKAGWAIRSWLDTQYRK